MSVVQLQLMRVMFQSIGRTMRALNIVWTVFNLVLLLNMTIGIFWVRDQLIGINMDIQELCYGLGTQDLEEGQDAALRQRDKGTEYGGSIREEKGL